MAQITKPVEGQNDGSETVAAFGSYKFRIALEALEGSKTISQFSREHEIHPNVIRTWKKQLLEDCPNVFASNCHCKQ